MRKIQYPIIKVIITIFAIIVFNTSFFSLNYNKEPDTFPAPSSIFSSRVLSQLLFTPVSITPLIDTEDARFDLNASRPIAKGDLKWRDALLVAHHVNSNLSHSCFSILRCLHRTFRIYFLIFIRIWSEEHEQKEDQ